MMDEIYSVTLDIMCTCFLGDYATEEVVEDIGRVLPVLANGIFSVPRSLPWPLNLFPAFAFGASMSARKELDSILEGVLQERRADPKSAESMADEGGRRAGVLDAFLALQKKQKEEDGGPGEGETVFDDRFIFDNVSIAHINVVYLVATVGYYFYKSTCLRSSVALEINKSCFPTRGRHPAD